MDKILNNLKTSVDISLVIALILFGSGAAYLRAYWAVFSVNLFNNLQVSEVIIGGINTGFNVLVTLLLVCVGFAISYWVRNSAGPIFRKCWIISFIILLFGSVTMIWVWFELENWLITGGALEALSHVPGFSIAFFLGLFQEGIDIKQKNVSKPYSFKTALTIILILSSWIVSTLDGREDALQIKHCYEYEYILGKDNSMRQGVHRIIGKLDDSYYFLSSDSTIQILKKEELLGVRSYDKACPDCLNSETKN